MTMTRKRQEVSLLKKLFLQQNSSPNDEQKKLIAKASKYLPSHEFDDLVYYLRRFYNDINDVIQLNLNIALNFYFYGTKARSVSVSDFLNTAGTPTFEPTIFADCFFRALFYSAKGTEQLLTRITINNVDAKHRSKDIMLCVDGRCFDIFQQLREYPSVVRFAKKLSAAFPDLVDLPFLVKMVEHKMDIKIFRLYGEEILMGKYMDSVWEIEEFCNSQPNELYCILTMGGD